MTDPDFISKLARYKTAYSPVHEEYVEITGHHTTSSGDVIVHVRLIDGTEMVFRPHELERYVL